ncbi:nitrogen fixation protein FixH [Tepidimonas sp.]|uniref:nitrogen fixation protein FixH n=1 Tax=Tepidimonas sp. TaxID=2002775 RepID=UPI002FDFC5B0
MTTLPPTAKIRPWYREPYVWLVIGGPLAVVIASVVTVVIAVRHADPVLPREAAPARVALPQAPLTEAERLQAEKAVLPAGVARNHVVSPALPKDDTRKD